MERRKMIKDPLLKAEYSRLKYRGYAEGYDSDYIAQRLAEIVATDIIGKAQAKRILDPAPFRLKYAEFRMNAGKR